MSLPGFDQLTPEKQQELLDGPALAPPPGVTPNLVDPSNGNSLALVVAILCLSIVTLLVLVRAYSRAFGLRRFRPEDFVGLLAYAFYCAYMYCVFRFLRNTGFFVHQWDVQLNKISEFLYIILIGSVFYDMVIMCIKLAIILEWLHIFVPAGLRGAFFWICWVVLVINTLYYIANIMAINLACVPYRAIWDITIEGRCIDTKPVYLSAAAINMFSDLVLLAIVQRVIWGLRLSLMTKFGVSLIFAAGIFACVAAGFRLAVTATFLTDADMTYSVSAVIMWAVGEMTSGFLVFCVPTAPNAVRQAGLPSKISSMFQSLTSRSKGDEELSKTSATSWPYQQPSAGAAQRKRDGDDLLLTTNVSYEIAPWSSDEASNLRGVAMESPGGVIRTTHMVTTSHAGDSKEVNEEIHSRQHPWMGPQ